MTNDNLTSVFIYRIDQECNISSLSSNWLSFALDNEGGEKNVPAVVLGKPLWNFISGEETRHLYQIILKEVRSNNKSFQLPFRCDSPDMRRYLQLSVIPLEGGSIEFQSRILRTEPRENIRLLEKNIARSEDFLLMCSTCKRVKVADFLWEETDRAITVLKLFENERLPQITHGMCPVCFEAAIQELHSM